MKINKRIKDVNSLLQGAKQIRALMECPVNERQVVVHNGEFHCDDVVAVALLHLVVGDFKVIRTRDESYLHEVPGRVVIDVGEGFFDHHGSQSNKDFCEVFISDGIAIDIPSCGASLIAEVLEEMGLLQIGRRLKNELIAICMQDNGMTWDYKPKTSFIHEFNTVFDEDRAFQDSYFKRAVKISIEVLTRMIIADEADLRAEKIIKSLPIDKEVVEVVPGTEWWNSLALEESCAKFVFYKGDNETWFLQCVPKSPSDRFSKRIPLPESWTRLPRNFGDFVFCHTGRFIAGFKTREAVLLAAEEALKTS